MDLFQFASPGVVQTQVAGASYFSINGGATNLDAFTTTSDLGDWASSVANDSFDALLTAGSTNPVSQTDITLMNVLGFQVAPRTTTPATPPTTVQQEILGLYAALHGRAAEAPGLTYWEGVVAAQPDAHGLTAATAATMAVAANDAQLLGQQSVASHSSFFNATYGGLTDNQFISAIYTNIGGNSGDTGGITYWTVVSSGLEAQGASAQL